MESEDLKEALLNLLSLLKKANNIEVEENINNTENDSISDIIEKIRNILWWNSDIFSNKVSNELENALSNLIKYYPQEISDKESFMMKCTYLLTTISSKQQMNKDEEENKDNEIKNDSTDDLFSKVFINKFSNGFGKELNDIQQEEQLSINKMNFLVQNLQDVKEIYKDEKKYWLLNNK